jgi:GxxExxY protein
MIDHEGGKGTEGVDDRLSYEVIGAAVRVHREVGPGLLESVYERCLCRELELRGIPYERQVAIPVRYRGEPVDCGFRLDLLIARSLIVEIKAVDKVHSIHRAQLLTYLRLTGTRIGLLINFNVEMLRHGVHRIVNG